MKKSIYKIRSIALIIFFSFAACDDFVTLTPTDSLVPESYYNNSEDAYRSLIGIYQILRLQRPEGMENVPIATLLNEMSDDSYVGGGSATDGIGLKELATFNATSGNNTALALWIKNFKGVQRANALLANYDRIEFRENESNQKKNYKAEALFLRAHFYFELVRFFENIPLLLEDFEGIEWREARQAAPGEVYAQIAKDMLDAIPDMAPGSIDKGRLLSWAAKAELVKVFMYYTGYYGEASLPVKDGSDFTKNDAITMLEDIIANSGYSLLSDYGKLFQHTSDYSPNFNNEAIFEVPYANNGHVGWSGEDAVGNLMNTSAGPRSLKNSSILTNGWGMDLPTRELMNDVFDEEGDVRKDFTFITAKKLVEVDPKATMGLSYTHTGGYNYKFTCWPSHRPTVGTWALNWDQNYVYIRLADVYLMAAELYLDNNLNKSLEYTNVVRNRAGLPNLTNINLDIIYKERRKELSLEGHRYWDVMRRGIEYAKSELDIANYTVEKDPNKPFLGEVGSPGDFEVDFKLVRRGLFPIPLQEMDRNPDFLQNPGYD
jgi:starch-binding outer membrane protein, SusD/RagB family